ncbi:replication restart helicase PriA [Aestuariivivens sediminicola]|uniref:replication restart helicase PriA n=1 Tax=Aestuariivivens sediminicola TaxID=2913560 RepID=UPI001F55DC77|nr:primosomal protein N' [Aestuariivivens sediminicola]
MEHFIDVIIPIPLQRLFTYHISVSEAAFIERGMRVAVPFGKSKIYTGIVFKIHQTPPAIYEPKEIHQILDEKPLVNGFQLELWEWIAGYYMCTLGEVMRAALPSAFILESETNIVRNTDQAVEENLLEDDEFLIYEALQHQSSLKIQDVIGILDKKQVLPLIHKLIQKKVVYLEEEVIEKYKPRLIRYVKLHSRYASDVAMQELLDSLGRAPRQKEVVLTLFSIAARTKKPVKVSELISRSGASSSIIRTLIDKEILEEYHIKTDRIEFSGEDNVPTKTLNSLQSQALKSIVDSFETHDVVLLHGVTSSGKTEVYSKLIEATLKRNRQVLYLLPEIALTAQLIVRLQRYFGDHVSVYHSRYTSHERVEVWYNVLHELSKAQIVVGARSSVFLPFSNLGLVIIDEEHEQSYKQFDPAPRYHARDTAIMLAKMHKAKTLLGSATPSLESYYNVRQDKYALTEINERYNKVLMPDIQLIDLKDKYKRRGMKGHFSDTLIEAMTEVLHSGHQVILFQNRRGFSPIVECVTCGHAPQCPNCDVSLTYHQYKNQLRCHYCGYHVAMHLNCEACGSSQIDAKGFGTEQIEEEVKTLFPGYKVARMDLDTTRRKYSYEKLFTALEQREIDVLVGTQMVTKGLDFRHVKLVGIMNADSMLNFPDFRAHERSFQLMLQVAGRAGRTDERGKVFIQTYNPYHAILQQVSTNNYLGMYADQMNDRHNYKYPPIYKLIKIILKHRDYSRVELASKWLGKSLRGLFSDCVLGPESPPVSRIRNQYYKNILIKIPKGQSLTKTKEAIIKINNSFFSIKEFRSVKIILNVDNF